MYACVHCGAAARVTHLQLELLVPLGTERVRLYGRGPNELGRHCATERVTLVATAAVLALEAEPEALVLAQLIVVRRVERIVEANVGQGARRQRRLR